MLKSAYSHFFCAIIGFDHDPITDRSIEIKAIRNSVKSWLHEMLFIELINANERTKDRLVPFNVLSTVFQDNKETQRFCLFAWRGVPVQSFEGGLVFRIIFPSYRATFVYSQLLNNNKPSSSK